MKIKKVTDPEFSRYGRVIDGYDFSKLIKAMEHTPLPEDVIYEPSIEELEATNVANRSEDESLRRTSDPDRILQRT